MTSSQTAQESNLSQTVLKAFGILECLADAGRPLSASEAARLCGVSRPTAYRLLNTLVSRGYVIDSEDSSYRLGTKVLSLSKNYIESLDLPELAKPYLRELSQASDETTYLSILDDTEILYVGMVESTQSVRMYCAIGTRNPLYCSSMGKAILAFLPVEERNALLDRITLTPRTANTITDKAELRKELELIRSQGFAIDNVEIEEGVRCLGAPVFNYMGQVFAAVSISGPAYRLSVERLQELSKLVIRATTAISADLGYVP
jgi:DNA-binding IclR family transcriptional regulator